MKPFIRSASTAGLVLCGTAAWAQAGNPLDVLPRAPAPAATRTDAQIAPAPAPAQAAASQAVTPTRFDIEGVKSIPFEKVAALFSGMVGKPTTVGAIVEQARKATSLYQDQGYALSFVFIPSQAFAGGVVRIVAVEGHVAAIKLEGDAGKSEQRIREIAAHIQAEKPLTRNTFERYTGLLGRLPGLTVQAEVPLPTSTDGATTLSLKASRKAYDVSIGTDLRQPQSRAIITGALNDPLIAGGQISASTLLNGSGNERFTSVQYTQAIGSEGLTLKASVSLYRGNPNTQTGMPAALPREAENIRRELSASYPLILTRSTQLTLAGGAYSVDNIDTTSNPANGAYLSDNTRVRAAFLQASYAMAEGSMARSANAMLVKGFNRFGAGTGFVSNVPGLSGPGAASPDFLKLLVDGSYAYRFSNNWGLAASTAVQLADGALPSTERISFGGSRFARGYAPGESAGDRGFGIGLEGNRTFAVDLPGIRQLQPYVLYETARVRNETGSPVPSKLESASLGLRIADLKHYSADFAVSKPTGDVPLENPERKHRFSLQLSWRLAD